MKKKLVILMLCTMMAVTAVGCGDNTNEGAEGTEVVESTEDGAVEESVIAASSAFADIKGSDYVELCDYSAPELTISGDYEVEDTEVTAYFEEMFTNYGPFYKEDPEKTTIGEGDIVNVDYVGKLDGEAFEGGSAENQMIDVYNNSSANGVNGYIEGFTDGLKGASVGDVIDCDVTFPENYGNADLAGKAVVFTFTVNSIQKEMTIEEVDDNFAKEQFQVDTVEVMYADIRGYLEVMAENVKKRDSYIAVQDYLMENCKVDVPTDYVTARVGDYKKQIIDAKCDGDETKLEEYVSTYYGKSVEEMEQEWTDSMTGHITLELIVDAIAEEQGVTISEEEFSAYTQDMMSVNGVGTVEILYQGYGFGDVAYGESYLRKLCLYETMLGKIVDTATINVVPAETEAAETVENTEAVESTED